LDRCDVWLLDAEITAWVVEAKDRPHLVVGLQGPADAPTRVLLIEGTTQPQSEPAEMTVTLVPGEANLLRETHFVFVSRRYLRRKPERVLTHAEYLGHVPATRLADVRRAVAACSLVAVKRCWAEI
jgi:mRNA-degrading endonuclease toxin of MazEF toxin-antitoxin module